MLTRLSHFWFDLTESWLPNHRIARAANPLPSALMPFASVLTGRSMIVCKAAPLPIECVVRGYLAGSGWKEYRASQTLCGRRLPSGIPECGELPEPVFTPATKAETGHDENISFAQAEAMVGPELAARARDLSLRLYGVAREHARARGILIADTKFEFGLHSGRLLLIDEVLTPDSSRFWPADAFRPGGAQPSYDKQFVRDYLESLDWDKTPGARPASGRGGAHPGKVSRSLRPPDRSPPGRRVTADPDARTPAGCQRPLFRACRAHGLPSPILRPRCGRRDSRARWRLRSRRQFRGVGPGSRSGFHCPDGAVDRG